MKLTHQQVHDALDFCEEQVKASRIWVCLRFEEYVGNHFATDEDWATTRQEFLKFGSLVQAFLKGEYQRLHPNDEPPIDEIDASQVLDGIPNMSAKELRLRMIEWLRTQYPLEKENG
jgi:hypothetical protein